MDSLLKTSEQPGSNGNGEPKEKLSLLPAASSILANMVTLVLAALLAFAIYAKAACQNGNGVAFGSFHAFAVSTGSMAPAIPIGSVVITARTPEEALKPGDVITYSLTEGTNDLVTHRIASRYAKPHYFITRGEANKQDDPIPVHYSQVVGKVILTLPMLGHVVDSFSSPLSAALLITMIFLLAAILQVVKRLMKENIA